LVVAQYVGERPDRPGEEPVLALLAGQLVRGRVVVDGGRAQEVRPVQPAAGGTGQVVDSGRVAQVRSAPFRQQGGQGGQVRIEVCRTADQDVGPGPAAEDV